MLRRKLVLGLIAGTVVATAVAAIAAEQGPPPFRESPLGRLIGGCLGRFAVLRSDLDLSDQQRGQIRDTLKGRRSEIVQQAESLWKKRVALRDAVLKSNSDEAEIRKAANELGKEIGNAAVLAAKIRGEVAPVFNDEQRAMVQKCFADNEAAVERFFEKAKQAQ